MADKVLTIVIPTYNMERYLERCLVSLISNKEDLPFLEVIVVNDGSKDRSSEIAHKYAQQFPESIIVIDKENGNYGSCINTGIEIASGLYFRILDADDWVDSEALHTFISVLKESKADLVITSFKSYEQTGIYKETFSCEVDQGRTYLIQNLSVNPAIMNIRMHTMTFRLSVLLDCDVRLSTGISYTDTEFCFMPLAGTSSIQFNDICLYQYDANREGQTVSASSKIKSVKSMSIVAERLLDLYMGNINCLPVQVRSMQLFFLKNISWLFYNTVLVLSGTDDVSEMTLRKFDIKVKQCPELDSFVNSLKHFRIPYVTLWRNYGIRNSAIVFWLHNYLFGHIKKLVSRIRGNDIGSPAGRELCQKNIA